MADPLHPIRPPQTGEEQNPLNFSQVFHLIPENGSYYVFNDVFRLVYG